MDRQDRQEEPPLPRGAQPAAGAGPPLDGGVRGAPCVQQVKTTLQCHKETQTVPQILLLLIAKQNCSEKKHQPCGAAPGFEQTLFPQVVL